MKKPTTLNEIPAHFIGRILKKIGDEDGIKVELEPVWKHVGRITRNDGTFSYFRGAHFDFNTMGAVKLAVDKDYTAYFLQKAGYRVIPGKTFYSDRFAKKLGSKATIAAAYKYAKKVHGFPVILKPNSSTQGTLVCTVYNKKSFMEAAEKICAIKNILLVQPLLSGHDYRLVVLDQEIISAYSRLPLTVIGNGTSTIDELLEQKQQKFRKEGRDTIIDQDDFRIDNKLKRSTLTRKSILAKGKTFALLDNCNLSSGGEAIDVTEKIDPFWKKLAVKIVEDMGLHFCGVDLMIQKNICEPYNRDTNNYHVIEINAAPGVDNYAETGEKQNKLVKEMYRKILHSLAGANS